MKKSSILAIVMIVAAVVVILTASKDVSSYATFTVASQSDTKVKISGVLDKEKEMTYNPEFDANAFSFFMKDSEGITKEVVLQQPKPQDFERSEQVVVTGKMLDDQFIASEILLKCPSKYRDEEISIRGDS